MGEWKIWYQQFDIITGKRIGTGFYTKSYKRQGYALYMGRKLYDDKRKFIIWQIGKENPWIRTCAVCGKTYSTELDTYYGGWNSRLFSAVEVRLRDPNNSRGIVYKAQYNICYDCAKKVMDMITGKEDK